jgi:hypothetical protein
MDHLARDAFLDLFAVERAHIELCARWSESERKARSTIGRRLSTICGFYKYCSKERLIERDPSAHVRRPKQDYESSTLGWDRNELGPANDNALRPRPRIPRSPRHLHRLDLRRRRQPLTDTEPVAPLRRSASEVALDS